MKLRKTSDQLERMLDSLPGLHQVLSERFTNVVVKIWKFFSHFVVGSTYGPSKIAKPAVFQAVLRGIGKSFQSAITAPRMTLIGYGNATAQS